MERSGLLIVTACLAIACGGGETSTPDPARAAPSESAATDSALPENTAPVEAPPEPAEPDPIDAGVAGAVLPPDLQTGIAPCDRMLALYISCDKIPQQSRDALIQGARTWRQSVEQGGDQARQALEQACVQALQSAQQALSSIGCADGAPTSADAGP